MLPHSAAVQGNEAEQALCQRGVEVFGMYAASVLIECTWFTSGEHDALHVVSCEQRKKPKSLLRLPQAGWSASGLLLRACVRLQESCSSSNILAGMFSCWLYTNLDLIKEGTARLQRHANLLHDLRQVVYWHIWLHEYRLIL